MIVQARLTTESTPSETPRSSLEASGDACSLRVVRGGDGGVRRLEPRSRSASLTAQTA